MIFCRLPHLISQGQDLQRYFENVGVIAAKPHIMKFDSLDDALQWVEDRILAEERPATGPNETSLTLADFEVVRGEAAGDPVPAAVAACAAERSCVAGEAIFRAGRRGDELYLIRRGIVRIELPLADGSHHNLAAFGRGNFFGEVAFLDAGIRSADAVAVTAVDLFVISRARFDTACRANRPDGVQLFARLARALALRLRRADAEISSLYDA